MPEGVLLLGFITLQRLFELRLANRNASRLRARGAVEFGEAHYPVLLVFHAIWLATLWVLGSGQPVQRGFLAAFVTLQAVRYWCIAILGAHWTTRVLVLPGAPLVRRGPYRFLRHPNYIVVALEIALIPLALGLPATAAIFSLLNIPLLMHRIAIESAALVWASGLTASSAVMPQRSRAR